MRASDVMSRDVVTVKPDDTVLHAVRLMLQGRISGLPVVNDAGDLVGIVTEGDLLRRSELETQRKRPRWIEFFVGPGRLADEYTHASGRKVHEVMTPDVQSVTEDAPLNAVVGVMERHRIKRVVIMRGRKLAGIITRANLLRALATAAKHVIPESASDTAIRDRLLDHLKTQEWAPVATIDISVVGGTVKLTGTILDDRQRQALCVAAENTPGVKKVEDRLVWVEPVTGMM